MLQMFKKIKLLLIRPPKMDFYLFPFKFLRFFIFSRDWGLALIAHVQRRFSNGLCSSCPQDARQLLGNFSYFWATSSFQRQYQKLKQNKQALNVFFFAFLVTAVTCSTCLLTVLSRFTLWNVKHWFACGY